MFNRPEPRHFARLKVKIRGRDLLGNPFQQDAFTQDVSARGVPDALASNPDFEADRQAIRALVARGKKEAESSNQVSTETLRGFHRGNRLPTPGGGAHGRQYHSPRRGAGTEPVGAGGTVRV